MSSGVHGAVCSGYGAEHPSRVSALDSRGARCEVELVHPASSSSQRAERRRASRLRLFPVYEARQRRLTRGGTRRHQPPFGASCVISVELDHHLWLLTQRGLPNLLAAAAAAVTHGDRMPRVLTWPRDSMPVRNPRLSAHDI